MILDLFSDTITIIARSLVSDSQGGFVATTAPSSSNPTLPGRIEPIRHASGARRMIAEQGDIAIGTHTLFCAAQTFNDDGSVASTTQLNVDDHVRSSVDANDYIVVAPPKLIRDRFLQPSHIEAELQVIGGAV